MAAPAKSGAALLEAMASHVHISISPGTKNLHESRQILAALQKFGEVTAFKNGKYNIQNQNPHKDKTILAIFDSSDSAHRAIAASPIHITITPDSSMPTSNLNLTSDSTATSNSATNFSPRTITCTIQESRHNHWDMYRSVPLIGLADVLQRSRKHWIRNNFRSEEEQIMLDDGRSLMRLWKEGLERENGVKVGTEQAQEGEEEKPRTGLSRVSKQMQKWAKEKEEEEKMKEGFERMGEEWIGHLTETKKDRG
ncbi:uncharacterized protein N7477_004017 [Penicillium maclennaniae]|uniref:uncharacterized protein n=1 Tax=Penicillium maclennaniae TaxID=1343394 RepID=UPI002540D14A|nr:uncharacterized protein N7477_004017 [Penicillium maclennaniae]KAJ5678384.1 hypothetical protein N7477_004017 [Penicillium maclennaniae]